MNDPSMASLGSLAIASAGAGATIICHVSVSRIWPALSVYLALPAGAVTGFTVLAVLTLFAMRQGFDVGDGVLADAAILSCFDYVYFHFNNMGETARRIRLLRDLIAANRPLTFEELAARYDAHEIVERRLARLLAAGQVAYVNERYILADRSIYVMARLVNLAHWIIFGHHRINPVRSK